MKNPDRPFGMTEVMWRQRRSHWRKTTRRPPVN